MSNTDFTIDRKSGFANILGLAETDIQAMSGNNGTLISVSISDLRGINTAFGRHHGDFYVQDLTLALNDVMPAVKLRYVKSAIFRISPNEYILMLPGMPLEEAGPLIGRLNDAFLGLVRGRALQDAPLVTRKVAYSQAIPHVSHLIKWSNKSWAKPDYTQELGFDDADWTNTLIERTMNNFLENLTLLREVDAMSHSDDISKLPNHRAAAICLNRLIHEYKSMHRHFSILFIDGDNLKRYNQLGYKKGNLMIEGLARIIKSSLREHEQVFRWLSGDEFLVCLPGTDLPIAMKVGERIRCAVESGTLDWTFPVTVSVGVANCPQDGTNADALILRAEVANGIAKNNGKNLVAYCADNA